jgi:threonine/homoserine/homoserine lactone efflux protein
VETNSTQGAPAANTVGDVLPTGHLLAFVVAAFVLIVAPGPSVLFVISRALTLGRRAALATVVGNAAGCYVQVVAVALGIGVVVERSILVFTVIKVAGAAYLTFLGVRTIRSRRQLARVLEAAVTPRATRRILREGFAVGASNPKTVIFFAAVLPQFVSRTSGHVPIQLLLLGLVFILIGLVSDSGWALMAATARAWFARSPRRLELIGGTGGMVIIGLGLRLAVTGRKD